MSGWESSGGAWLHRVALRTYRALPPLPRRWIVRTLAPSYTVGAIVVITDQEGRVLLVRQSYRRNWGLPGGLLQRGEDPAAAVVREVMEEVGVRIKVGGRPIPIVEPRPQRIDLVFRAGDVEAGDDADGGQRLARPCSPEIAEVAWFAPESLPALQAEAATALAASGFACTRSD